MPLSPPVKLVIDTDGGVDDAVAIWWAATSPAAEVVAVTTVHGNVDVATATDNACRVLHACGAMGVPVAAGHAEALGPVPVLRPADFIHGSDGLGNTFRPKAPKDSISEHAVDVLRRVVDEQPGEIVVVAIGPMTNVAAVIHADPSWASRVGRLVIMGGAVMTQGNALPVGEANIAHDPTAADIVVGAAWATPLLIGLDVTHRATFTATEIALVEQHNTAAGEFLDQPLAVYRRFGGTFCAPGEFPCHDALAVMAAVHPGLVGGPVLPLAIQVAAGPAQGATVVDRRGPYFAAAATSGAEQAIPDGFAPWQIGLEVDVERFRAALRGLFE